MSLEAKLNGGGVPSVKNGGLCASLQSIGARGKITPSARANIKEALEQHDMIHSDEGLIEKVQGVVELPYYFSSNSRSPTLQSDYQKGGYNYTMAERMLNESILPFCIKQRSHCDLDFGSAFRVIKLERLENAAVFERYKRYESGVAEILNRSERASSGYLLDGMPKWLKQLSAKNDLSSEANSVYLLHGTLSSNVQTIVDNGLKAKFSLANRTRYGKGLYFAENACKASQYGTDGCILVCRVVLGRTEVLRGSCEDKLFPSQGYNSAMARKNVTSAPLGLSQLHNEYIVYDERGCYPEFVVHFEIRK